jgi:hypothetical protein
MNGSGLHTRPIDARTGSARGERRSRFRLPFWLGFCAFLAIAVFFLWQEHRAHLFGALPWLLLLLCPALHLFMHHGEGHGHGGDAGRGPDGTSSPSAGDAS